MSGRSLELTAALAALDAKADPMPMLRDLFAAGVELERSVAVTRPDPPTGLAGRLACLGSSVIAAPDLLPWPTAAWLAVEAAGSDLVVVLDVGDELDARWLAQARRSIRGGDSFVVAVPSGPADNPTLGPILLATDAARTIGGLDTGQRSRREALRGLLVRARAAGFGVRSLPSRGAVAPSAWDVADELDRPPRDADETIPFAGVAVFVASEPLALFGPTASAAAEAMVDTGYLVRLATPDPDGDVVVDAVGELASDPHLVADVVICFDPQALLRARPALSAASPSTGFVLVAGLGHDQDPGMERAVRSADLVASIGPLGTELTSTPLRPPIVALDDVVGAAGTKAAWRSVVLQALDDRRRVLG